MHALALRPSLVLRPALALRRALALLRPALVLLPASALLPALALLAGSLFTVAAADTTQHVASASGLSATARGRAYFTTCAGCHGTQAQGNSGMHAPNLTVQGSSYLLEQLRHFAHDIRGGPTDFYGWQMNGRAKALPDDSALRDVVAFIETLPRARASPMVTGNVAHGRELYSACASCHGARGEGSGSTVPVGSVPALAGLDDYYQLAQLEAFTSGARGTKKDDDPQGAIMRAAAAGITSKEAARDVVAYIATLQAR